jgi:uncharacterized delta-60 repeat protein
MGSPRLLALLLAGCLTAVPAAAAAPPHAGSFDRTFGHNGRVTLKFQSERIAPTAVAVQPDRKIVVAGTVPGDAGTYPGEFAGRAVVFRFLPDGSLDPSFGDNGIARAGFATPLTIRGLALQPDGALLLSGTTLGSDFQWMGAVVRLLPSGAVDEGFGSDGIARIPGGPGYPHDVNSLSEIGAQADGRIVAAGTQRAYDVHIPHDPYLIRLMPDGSPDLSFGGGVSRQGTANPIAVLPRPSGDTVVVGWDEEYFGTTYLTVLGLGPNGRTVQTHYQRSYTAIAAAVRPDGTIDVVGELVNFMRSTRRFLAHTRIGEDLQILGQSKVPNSDLTAATFDARGAMLAARSWLYPYDPPPFRIERYRDMRQPDRSFGNRSGARDVFFARPGALTGLAMQGDKLIVAGYTYPRRTLRRESR